ncbi:MAG: hypothetical protein ACRD4X_12075 [Candidatus Acidiferrales bacterium]
MAVGVNRVRSFIIGPALSAEQAHRLGAGILFRGRRSFSFDKWVTLVSRPPQTPPSSPNACQQPILNAVNNQFGDNFTPADVGTGQFAPFPYPQVPGGTINIDIFVPPQDQPDGVSPGRYPINWWTYIVGYGPTLHIPSGPGGLDSPSTLLFSTSQFTAHIDSAFPYNPFGLLFHS